MGATTTITGGSMKAGTASTTTGRMGLTTSGNGLNPRAGLARDLIPLPNRALRSPEPRLERRRTSAFRAPLRGRVKQRTPLANCPSPYAFTSVGDRRASFDPIAKRRKKATCLRSDRGVDQLDYGCIALGDR